MKKILLALLLASGFNTFAQTPQLVEDLDPGIDGSAPLMLTVYNNKLYFSADVSGTGRELYVYDGANTNLLYDINPGGSSSQSIVLGYNIGIFNNKAYFYGNNGTDGSELMMYDGINTPAIAADIVPGSDGSAPRYFVAYNGKLYFSAYTATTGLEFYTYDGVNAPAMIQLNPGVATGCDGPKIEYNGKIYFNGNDGVDGYELFCYNPQTNTVTQVEDIEPGSDGSSPRAFIVYNNKLYFIAVTDTYGAELYSYDGANVVRVTDVTTGSGSGISNHFGTSLMVYNGYIYFPGSTTGSNHQLYKYDPSNNTTSLVYTINNSGHSFVSFFVLYANKLFFMATDGVNGQELWMHDGTNTSMVHNLGPGADYGVSGDAMPVYNGSLYFYGNNGTSGSEVFSYTDAAASVKRISLNGDISVAPNPTTGDVTLQFALKQEQRLNIQLTDVAGKLVYERPTIAYPTGNTNVILPLSGQAAGIYFYNITDNEGKMMASGKIQKQ